MQLFMPLFWTFVNEDHSKLQTDYRSKALLSILILRIIVWLHVQGSAVHFSVKIRVLFAMAGKLFIL